MIEINNQRPGFIYKNGNNIDKIMSNGNVVFEQGFIREDSGSTPLTTSHEAIGKDLKNYRVYGNSRQSKLPDGYTQINYIEGNNTGYIPTDIYLTGDDVTRIKFRTVTSGASSCCLYGFYRSNRSDNYSVYIQEKSYASYFRYGDDLYTGKFFELGTIYDLEMCSNYIKINDTTYSSPFTAQTFTTRDPICIGWLDTSSSAKLRGRIYSFEIVGKAKLLPCKRNTDNQIGMYDVMNNNFYPAEGTLTAGADVTPSPNYPIQIESVGNETVNLFNPQSNWNINGTIGTTSKNFPYTTSGSRYTYFFKCKPNTKYTVSFKTPGDRLVICGLYTEVDPTIYTTSNRLTFDHYIEKLTSNIPTSLTFTTDVNDKMIGIYYVLSQSPTEMQIEENSQATSYEPYYEGYKIPITVSDGTNTTNMYINEPLRKVGNYADYIDYETQKVYRNVIVNDDSGEQTIENSYSGTTDTIGTSVTLPNIPSLVGTTTYDVDTKVKPSNMYIKYKGK